MLDYPVTYHDVELNTIEQEGEGKRSGCLLEEFDWGRAQGVGYTERRAQADGLNASDVYLGARYINLTGIAYGSDPGDLHDRLQDIRTALTPTVSFDFDEPNQGYIPLKFTVPTNNTDEFPTRIREVQFLARPLGQPQFAIRRDSGEAPGLGGPQKGGGIMWRASLECKDPRLYLRPDTWVQWTTATPGGGASIVNRGDYPAPLDVLLVAQNATSSASKVEIDLGKGNITLAMGTVGPPASGFPAGTVFRYSDDLRVYTVQVPSGTEVLRQDLRTFRNAMTDLKVPPGTSLYAVRLTSVVLATGTRFMYSESFA